MNKDTVMGRPIEYKEEYCEMAEQYLAEHQDIIEEGKQQVKLPTLKGFASYIGIAEPTLYEWDKTYPNFSKSLDKIRAEQHDRLVNKALGNQYNSTIAKLMLSSNHGYREKTEQDITSAGKPIPLLGNVISTNNSTTEDSE